MSSLEVEGIVFRSFPSRMKGHIALIDDNDIGHIVHHYPETLFVLAGGAGLEKMPHGNTCIALGEGVDLKHAFNKLSEILDAFDIWERELKKAVDEFSSYDAIVRCTDAVLDKPMSIMDDEFRYVAYSKRLAAESGHEAQFVDEHGYLPLEYINIAVTFPRYRESLAETGVYQMSDLENGLHKNVFYEDKCVGRITLPSESDEAANDCSAQVLLVVARAVERLYAKTGTFFRSRNSDSRLRGLLCDALDGRRIDLSEEARLLKNRAFKRDEDYYLVQFRSNMDKIVGHLGESLSTYISMHWPGCIGFTYQEKTLMLANATYFERASGQDFEQTMALFLRESLLVAGLSRSFHDLADVRAAYIQTDIALACGELLDPTQWFPKFDSYALWHLIHHGAQGFLPRHICDPAVNALHEYDRAHGTELNKTLKVFIHERYNAVAAAKVLHLSRSAFLKRLSRIDEIANVNLGDPRRRLYVALSYELFDQEVPQGSASLFS